MRAIWKYKLDISTGIVNLKMPAGGLIIKIDKQRDDIVLWAIIDPNAEVKVRGLMVAGTGINYSDDRALDPRRYLGTVFDEPMVWHFFDLGWGEPVMIDENGKIVREGHDAN